ncbi:MAG: (Fe-S)-binding protein [Desulfitobacteriaceae bacterium]
MYRIEDYAQEINRCIQCNFCLEHCPVYREDGVESSVARGRLNLIQALLVEKTLVPSDRAGELLNRCLLCTSCTQGCPSGIPVDDIVITARTELQKKYGLGRGKRFLLRQVLNRSNTTNLATWALSIGKRLNMVPDEFPEVASRSFEQRVSANVKPKGEVRGKVGYFIGCATNYLYPEIGDAVIKVLTANGYEVVIPENQHCCGIPALAHGELAAAQEAVRWNADLFADLDVDAVVTDCTSCGYMLKVKAAKTLDKEDPYQGKVAAVAGKVVEITEFVTREGLLGEPQLISQPEDVSGKSKDKAGIDGAVANGKGLKVTYHVPCHRAWSPNLVQAPRKLIPLLPEVSLVEMNEPQKCCGAGGSFFVDHEELSETIRERKLEDILRTEADAVITQCPACRYYLSQGLKEKMPVLHPIELLARRVGQV